MNLLEKAIYIVEKNKASLGKVKNMSSLEKNRIALNLITSLKQSEKGYNENKNKVVNKNVSYIER